MRTRRNASARTLTSTSFYPHTTVHGNTEFNAYSKLCSEAFKNSTLFPSDNVLLPWPTCLSVCEAFKNDCAPFIPANLCVRVRLFYISVVNACSMKLPGAYVYIYAYQCLWPVHVHAFLMPALSSSFFKTCYCKLLRRK